MEDFGVQQGHLTFENGDLEVSYYEKQTRTNRKPRNTGKYEHDLVDEWFDAEFGMAARSMAVFCFGEMGRRDTRDYGSEAVIFPIGDFKYVWSPEVGDLYQALDFPDDRKSIDAYIETKLPTLKYKTTDLNQAVKDDAEIMIMCKRYLAIPLESNAQLKEIKEIIKNL